MGVAMLEGREFRSSDEGKTANVAIVNQAFADRYFPHANTIGRKIWLNGRDKPATEIVGEVSNGRTDDLTQEASPEIYLSLWQATAFSKHLVIRTVADPSTVLVAVERELRAVDPTAAIENPKTLEQIRDDSLASRTFAMQLLVGFSVVGSVLTLVGIYGVLSLSVAGGGDSQRDWCRTKRHPELDLRRGISINCERRTYGCSPGDRFVACAEDFSV